jgi:hypothetical protein
VACGVLGFFGLADGVSCSEPSGDDFRLFRVTQPESERLDCYKRIQSQREGNTDRNMRVNAATTLIFSLRL